MCYTAIPSETGLVSVREVSTSQKKKQASKSVRTRKDKRSVNPASKAVWIVASAIATRIVSMSPEFIKDNRSERRPPYDGGKHRAKHFIKCRSKRLARRFNELA